MSQITVNVELKGFEALTRSQLNQAIRESLSAMALRWKRRYLPKHFTKAGAREYGYKPRQGEENPMRRGSYTNRKLRLFSHTLPNVYTGELRRLAVQGPPQITAKATSSHAHVRVSLPRKANFRLHELQILSEAERHDLARLLVEDLERRLSRPGGSGSATAGIAT